jgi:polyhydroxyalkanoate synthesis repressor PhaR
LSRSKDPNIKQAGSQSQPQDACRLIKKYPNRRLYDTRTSSYITLQEVKAMVIDAETIKVIDAKSEEDLTRSIFLQIILEEEAGGLPLFSEAALANMIRFYGHAMQPFMGNYLEKNIQQFLDMQAQLAQQSQQMTPEVWAQFLANPAGGLPTLVDNYTQQSNQMMLQLQEQMLKAMGLKR